MENTYGIGIANRYDLFYGQDDVTEFETVVSKKKKEKKEPALLGQPQPAAAEKENKAQPKPTNAAAPPKAQSQDARKAPLKGIKEQNAAGKKDGECREWVGERQIWGFLDGKFFTQKMCSADLFACVGEFSRVRLCA